MVMTFDETKELEALKQKNKLEQMTMQNEHAQLEHNRKMERLDILLKIAEAKGTVNMEV